MMIAMKKSQLIFQLKITLLEITPPIWRRVQVPAHDSFWDLHVALQDAMGWLDCHLHAFRFPESHEKRIEIGIPGDELGDIVVLPGWEVAITDKSYAVGFLSHNILGFAAAIPPRCRGWEG
jgi:hypothetical protein